MTRARACRATVPKLQPAPPRAGAFRAYGLYFMDVGRATRRAPPFSCASDADAQRCAEQRREGRPAELRSGDRLIARWARGAGLVVEQDLGV